jgi:hypothetical protein
MIWQPDVRDLYRGLRRRILAETEQFLNHCLLHPEKMVRIPRIRVGAGSFSPEFARRFWAQVLSEDVE